MNIIHQISAVLLVATLSSSNILKSGSTGSTFELLILHNNDMHARFEQTSQLSGTCTVADREAGKCYGGFPRVAHVVKEARKAAASGEGPPVLYLNAGDTYTGTVWFTTYKWKIAAEFLNALQPDAVSLGNHELDEDVSGVTPFIEALTMPVLAANLILDKVPEMQNLSNLYPSITLVVNDNKIGVIGYLTPDTKYLVTPNEIVYEDEIISLRREVKRLKSQGVKILIALGHSGYLKDLEIARDVEDIDLVVGGHSHTLLMNENSTNEKPEYPLGPYPTIVEQASGRKVPVVQAYAFTKYLGKLNLIFDDSGEIQEVNGIPILLDHSIPRDPEVLKLVQKYSEKIDAISNEVLGTSVVQLNGDTCRIYECNLGNFITDVVSKCIQDYDSVKYTGVDIVIVQGGRIRTSIDHPNAPFEMTWGDWIAVIPYSDYLVKVTMNGTILKEAFEHSVEKWSKINSPGQFLQFSGLNVTFDLSKPPNQRIVEIKARSPNGKYDIVRDNAEYNVVMPYFLSDNGDGYTMFQGLPKEILPFAELRCITDFLKTSGAINPKLDNRLNVLNEDKINLSLTNKILNTKEVIAKRLLPSNTALDTTPSRLLISSIAVLYYILK